MTTSENDADRAYRQLRRAIVEGRVAPGSRLVEQRLAEEHDMSRTPVREALRRLAAEGLIEVVPNRGAQVRSLSKDEIADLYGLRARLEAYGATLAADRAGPEDVRTILGAATAFEEALGDVDDVDVIRRLDDANGCFHQAILDASGHRRLRRMVDSAVDAPLVFQALQRFDETELSRSASFHHLIAEAVQARAGDRAGRLMTEHVLQGRDTLLQRINDAGDLGQMLGSAW